MELPNERRRLFFHPTFTHRDATRACVLLLDTQQWKHNAMIHMDTFHWVTYHALGHGDLVVVSEFHEEVKHVERGGRGEGGEPLESLEGHLIAQHSHVQPSLDLVQLTLAL
eukprot:TRINITY_DN151934_c0_g2_i2.p1 TRINITY_DN151934_c0_g2~~TRINITY_DN151934_c0_g2_i2.p1  ORF type:complete len:111 (+),score=14.79 TRINITY_DN151934_c0_g2_i2:184-516(+)